MAKTEQREYTRVTHKLGNRIGLTILFVHGAFAAIVWLLARAACGAV